MNSANFKPAAALRNGLRDALRRIVERLSPKQRQVAMLGGVLLGGIGLLWLVFAANDNSGKDKAIKTGTGTPSAVTNIGVMPPGQQVNPVDQWVGTAGSKLAQYETEREEQGRLNKDRQAFEARTMQRFSELEQRLTSATQAAASNAPPATAPAPMPPAPQGMPPAASLPPPLARPGAMPPGVPGGLATPTAPAPAAPVLTRITLSDRAKAAETSPAGTSPGAAATSDARTVSTFLPVSFTRGTLLGGLDAPTGGQSQSNPHPVLIRLSDNSVLPNRFRGEYRDCFVIAAGYGDISSERAYLRTENLSCVRADGATLEVKVQGSVYGEDGKVGMRGRLVTKQGQMLANALLAGVVSGIGQGVSSASTTYSTSALGTIASASGAEAYRAGIGSGVGKALDRLAQYYIKLAENTFPVIEIDAGREIDVVITKGVRIDVPMTASVATSVEAPRSNPLPTSRYQEPTDDGDY
ncbi:TraB/VirB10 family protein [Sphaerotilus sp.]|uniref:TraB/VirB10 family protein n=1 Tax=Sphaerotilus sp. TaxID=2093942 RepID=UPI002ACE0ECC|nr:TraB/VirB10 family protein [Sphaerotilus sp.]MDZ7855935.1 TraB/VirB10 family protein [Sphaerotilus sp.]